MHQCSKKVGDSSDQIHSTPGIPSYKTLSSVLRGGGPTGRALGPKSARNMIARHHQQQQKSTTEEVKTLVIIETEVRK